MIISVIQLAVEQVSVSRFAVRRGELTFLGARQAECGEGKGLAVALRELTDAPLADERVVLAIPPRLVAVRQVRLPLADRRKVREILPLELKGELAQDAAELVFDALPAGEGEWTACWVAVSTLSPLLAALREAGYDAECATFAPASWGALIPVSERAQTVAVSDGSGCAVFADGRMIYCRPFVISPAEEIRRTQAALEMGLGRSVDRWYLLGQAAEAWTAQSGNFPSGCSRLPSEGPWATCFAADPTAARQYASAAALAQTMAAAEPLNFRQGGVAYTAGRERLRKALRVPAVLAICLVLALFAELGVRWQLLRSDIVSLDKSIGAIYREVFPKRKPVDEAAEFRAEIRRLAGSGAESVTLATLKLLAEAKGEGITALTEVEQDGTTVRLRGEAASLQAVNDLKGRLATQFTGVELVESRSKGGSGGVTFVLRGSGAGVGK